MSERLLFNAKRANFQQYRYHNENKLHLEAIDDKDAQFVLTRPTRWVDLYSGGSLKQQSTGRHVSTIRHISRFRANQFLLLLLNPVRLAQAQEILMLLSSYETHDVLHSRYTSVTGAYRQKISPMAGTKIAFYIY